MLIEENRWRAARFGVEAKFVDYHQKAERPFGEAVLSVQCVLRLAAVSEGADDDRDAIGNAGVLMNTSRNLSICCIEFNRHNAR